VPVMVIRGTNSDILSTATVEAMRQRRRGLDVVEVVDEGHPPRLADPQIARRIAAFVSSCDDAANSP
jgi:pimeloyl-ACP methyl ester carboxylesterase